MPRLIFHCALCDSVVVETRDTTTRVTENTEVAQRRSKILTKLVSLNAGRPVDQDYSKWEKK
jgi:hypothetical protein